jgi:hypothetical protein
MNTDIWDKVKQPPKDALKSIGGGRLRGMTDINPQWRLEVMTQTFGPAGKGWMYSIEKLWSEDGSDGEKMGFALISLRWLTEEGWSEPIPGIGGSMMTAKEKSGLYNSDEVYKMAVTDALSVAMKALGVGSDIYRGKWDGSKYQSESLAHDCSAELSAIAKAETLDDLKSIFGAAWTMVGDDNIARTKLTEAKDKRKRELS